MQNKEKTFLIAPIADPSWTYLFFGPSGECWCMVLVYEISPCPSASTPFHRPPVLPSRLDNQRHGWLCNGYWLTTDIAHLELRPLRWGCSHTQYALARGSSEQCELETTIIFF